MRRTIVIVDDEAPIRRLLKQAMEELEDEGADLLLAEDGVKALALIQETRPDVVLLDVMMPQMNGFDVCRAVKADPSLSGVRIVLLTAKGQESDRRQGEAAGADLYLTKPFDPDALLETVRGLLEKGD